MKQRRHSKIGLKIVEDAIKSAEDFHKSPMAKEAFYQAKRFDEERGKVFNQYKEMIRPKSLSYGLISFPPPRPPVTIAEMRSLLAEQHKNPVVKKIDSGVKTAELIYNRHDKELKKYIGNKEISCDFSKKRLSLLEVLLDSDGYVETSTLMDMLKCPTSSAVSKLAKGVNNRTKNKLQIKEKLIDGRSGFGYRINPKIRIHKE